MHHRVRHARQRSYGQTLACLADVSSGTVLADAQTGDILLTMSASVPLCRALALALDGQTFVSGHLDGSILLWDLINGRLIRQFSGGLGNINKLIFNGDGQTLYVASHPGAGNLATVTAWDVSTGELYRRYGGFPVVFDALSLSNDGRKLLAGAYNGIAWIWRINDLPSLLEWIQANRYIPELTCEQRELYQLKPLCPEAGVQK